MPIFEDLDSVYSLITEINQLRNTVKCPICLDIITNPLQISCDHLFCADCIHSFLNDTPSKLKCPVCRKSIKRQRQKPNENIEQLVNFVQRVSEKINVQFGCDISVFGSIDVHNIFGEGKTNSRNAVSVLTGTSMKTANEKYSHDELPHTSNEDKNAAFDRLIKSHGVATSFKKNKNVKTYGKKTNKWNNNEELYQRLIQFEDDKCKLNILKWLCDNRNKFDRLTQTQSIIDDDSDTTGDSFNMPSISQKQNVAHPKTKDHSCNKKRTRSLEVQVKRPKFKSRNLSHSDVSQKDIETVNIEEADSDTDILDKEQINIIHMLEENCLNTIDSQVGLQEVESSYSEKSKNVTKRRRKKNDNKPKTTSTGWARIKEMNKTINKRNRGLKKLHVNLSSSAKKTRLEHNFELEANNSKAKVANMNPVVLLNSLSSEFELYEKAASLAKSKAYNLEEVETYITNNINNSVNSKKKNSLNVLSNSRRTAKESDGLDIGDLKAAGEEKGNRSANKSDELQVVEEESGNTKGSKCDFVCEVSQSSYKEKEKTRSGSIFSRKEADVTPDELFIIPTQKINHELDIDNVERDLIALFSSPEPAEKRSPLDCDFKDDETEKMNEISEIVEGLCKAATELEKTCKNNINIDIIKLSTARLKLMFTNINSRTGIADNREIKEILMSPTKTAAFDTKSIAIQTEDYDSSGFKISSTVDFKTLERCTIGVQTDEVLNENNLRTGIQMSMNNTKSIGTQTNPLESKAPFVTECRESLQRSPCVPTDTTDHEDPICITSDSSFSSRTTSEILFHIDEIAGYCKNNYEFSESMDNINFDTQVALVANNKNADALLKQTHLQDGILHSYKQSHNRAKKKLTFNKATAMQKSPTMCSSDDIQVVENKKETTLELKVTCNDKDDEKKAAQNSTVSFSITQENNDTINNSTVNKFKRIRSLMDDGDCDDRFIKKIKMRENPYLVSQLSVEFESQAVEEVHEDKTQNNTIPSVQISQSLNYDDYLDKIMEKYEKNELKTSTPRKQSTAQRQTKSQCIISKCNTLIKEATSTPSTSLPKTKLHSQYNELTSDDIIKEFDLPFGELESNVQRSPNFKQKDVDAESVFSGNLENVKIAMMEEMPFSNMKPVADDHNPISAKSVTKDNKSLFEIKVLQNVLLQKENGNEVLKLPYNLEDELQKIDDNIDKGSQKSEEIFSDSDVDVVETTPQKDISTNNMLFMSLTKRPLLNIRPSPPPNSSDLILATETASYFDRTFEPPAEFQDCNNLKEDRNTLLCAENFDTTLVQVNTVKIEDDEDMNETLTEAVNDITQNKQIRFDKQQSSSNSVTQVSQNSLILPSKGANTNNQQHIITNNKHPINDNNLPNSINMLDISTVQNDTRALNPIERALKSNYNPLEIIPTKSQQKRISNLRASTPKRQDSILTYVNNQSKVTQKLRTDLMVPVQSKVKPCIACTRASKIQMAGITSLAKKELVTFSHSFNNSVTHMIVSVNEKNCIQDHTMKFVSAVSAGIWVLGFNWIQECLSQNTIVQEEPYEVLDISGVPGPKTARLTRLKNPLLRGFHIYTADPFLSISKSHLESIIQKLDGQIVSTLKAFENEEMSGIRVIIAEANASQDFDIYETWLETFKVITVDIEWLTRSVSQYRLLSLRPFVLCSDENIDNLEYPNELLVDTPFSISQSIYNP